MTKQLFVVTRSVSRHSLHDGHRGTVPSVTTLAGVLRLAHVPAELLLDVGLGIDGPAERAHRDVEFTAAECTDCNDRSRAKPNASLDGRECGMCRKTPSSGAL
jgi:hypothetical protein